MEDFLVDLARSGRQVIAETHSEHLLLRVRRLVAARTRHKGIAADDLSVVHVGKSARSGTARIQRLELDDLGQIKAWPRGFFEEANDERLALLEETARRVEGQRP
ncbi:MAG: DUF3696 domain-containing protein [Deltaproteobacteria bacterium]|nr:DUF3696 domain-containing protein [Deltaproteobacteria bacterium]